MMENNDMGESSCKKHSHSDNSASNSRPLKKAKFPWQVKGKYHLKDQDEAMDEDPVQEDDVSTDQRESGDAAKTEESPTEEKHFDNKVEENLEMLGDYLLKQDFSSLNTLLFGPEVELRCTKKPIECISTYSDQSASTTYPKYTPTYKKVPNSNNNNDSSISSNNLDVSDSSSDVDSNNTQLSVSIKQRSSRIEDQYLKRWQARQIAKGYVDNTINRVLDSWFVTPLPPYLDENRQITLDVTGLLDDLASDDGIENEGILMAISAHGLQNNARNMNPTLRPRDLRNADCNSFNRNSTSRSHTFSDSDAASLSETPSNSTETYKPENSTSHAESSANVCDSVDNNSNPKEKIEPEETVEMERVTSPEPPAWRHLSEACNCTNLHRRVNNANVPPVPFHRRNYTDNNVLQMSTDNNSDESMVSNVETVTEPSAAAAALVTDKRSSENSNNNESLSSSNSLQNNYSMPNANDEQFEEHFDFLDAAVSYAIQAKGLIPY